MRRVNGSKPPILDTLPNYDYLNDLNDSNLKIKMIALLIQEFSDYSVSFDERLNQNSAKDWFFIVHKISSKFSILGLNDSFTLSKKIEQRLSDGEVIVADLELLNVHCKQINEHLKEEQRILLNT